MDNLRSDEEQIAALRQLWNRYGLILVPTLLLAAAVFIGLWTWNGYKTRQNQQASALYQQLLEAEVSPAAAAAPETASQQDSAHGLWERLKDGYCHTTYAQLGALLMAGKAVQGGDLKAAQEHLEWLLERHPGAEIDLIARLRLARVLLALPADDRKAQAARGLELLQAVTVPRAFSSAVEQVRGDLLLAQEEPDKAYAAYSQAADNAAPGSLSAALMAIKRDDLTPRGDSQ